MSESGVGLDVSDISNIFGPAGNQTQNFTALSSVAVPTKEESRNECQASYHSNVFYQRGNAVQFGRWATLS